MDLEYKSEAEVGNENSEARRYHSGFETRERDNGQGNSRNNLCRILVEKKIDSSLATGRQIPWFLHKATNFILRPQVLQENKRLQF